MPHPVPPSEILWGYSLECRQSLCFLPQPLWSITRKASVPIDILASCALCAPNSPACICSRLKTLSHEWSFYKSCQLPFPLCSTHAVPCSVHVTFMCKHEVGFPNAQLVMVGARVLFLLLILSPVLLFSAQCISHMLAFLSLNMLWTPWP